ncbi:hypothetical protein CRG98_006485 [Punica granatum]|uniref:Uncharacterized protein n=1 Tax=Punica granatum TaxID=22663 RepID=A0A2I0KXQ6_PUNGR|nr:hypothetical protein CRG98_006485 [Punica granatum]
MSARPRKKSDTFPVKLHQVVVRHSPMQANSLRLSRLETRFEMGVESTGISFFTNTRLACATDRGFEPSGGHNRESSWPWLKETTNNKLELEWDNLSLPTSPTYRLASVPALTFPYTLRTLLLSGLRVHGLRVRFTTFRTSRPRTSRPDFASPDFASTFTAFQTSRPFYCFLRASTLHLPLHTPQIPLTLLSHDRGGDLPQRTTIEAAAGTKRRGKLSAPYFGPPASHSRIPDRSPGRYSSTGNQRQIGGHGVMSNKRRARSTEKGGREQSKERTDKESRKRRSRHCGTIPNAFPGQAARAGTPRSLTDAFSNRAPGARSTDKQTALQNGPTGTQGPSRSANKLQMTFRNSTWFPEGRFSGQNQLSRRRVARTFVYTTHGDIRLVQILVIQAFQIFKLIGHRRSDASSIKFQAFSGFSLNRMGPTVQPS